MPPPIPINPICTNIKTEPAKMISKSPGFSWVSVQSKIMKYRTSWRMNRKKVIPRFEITGMTLGKYILLNIPLLCSNTFALHEKLCKKTFQKTIAEKNVRNGFSRSWAVPRMSLNTTTSTPLETSGCIICQNGPIIDCLNWVLNASRINWEIIFL